MTRAAAQDAVKLSGFWIEPVEVVDVRTGLVRYTNAQGITLERPFADLEGLKLERSPSLSEAEVARLEGNPQSADELYQRAASRAKADWVRWYAGMRRVEALSALDRAGPAVDVYLELIVTGAGMTYVAMPPVGVVGSADVPERGRIKALIGSVIGTLDPERAALLKQLDDAAGDPPTGVSDDVSVSLSQPDSSSGGPALSGSVPPSSIVNLYRAGRYDRALDAVDEALTQPGRTASELYLKGMCQFAIAEKAADPDGYKSAGLSFMRVLTYYPRSAVAGPAYLEAGWVHHKIGRPAIAAKMLTQARVLIDPKDDPAGYARLNRLADELD